MAKAGDTLESVLGGKKVSDSKVRELVETLHDKANRAKNLAARARENAGTASLAGIYAAEAIVGNAAASFAANYFGEEKMQVFGVDLRAVAGLVGAGWGLLKLLSGDDTGHHYIAAGMGPAHSFIASKAGAAGAAFAQKRGSTDGVRNQEIAENRDINGDGKIGAHREIPANPNVHVLDPFGTVATPSGWKVAR